MKTSFNNHHLLPQSQGGTSIPANILRMNIKKHDALHMLFANDTPPAQIMRLIGINSTALTQEFKEDVARILQETDPSYYYKNGILRPNRI